MSLITIVWSMGASACLTLAAISFLVWCRDRKARAYIFFALLAIGTAAFAWCEVRMMRAETPAEFAAVLKWGHVAIWLIVVSLVGFVWFYLNAGRLWLAWTICGLRTLALVLNFLIGQNLNYLEITRLREITFFGEIVHIAEGVHNPWMLVSQVDLTLVLIFILDASVTAWRRGDRQRARAVGASATFFMLFSILEAVLVLWGIVKVPIVASMSIMGLIAVMGYDLGNETIRASLLYSRLRDSEAGLHEFKERMMLAVEAAGFGILVRDFARDEIWATSEWRAMLGFTDTEQLVFDRILHRVHPEDRESVRILVAKAIEGSHHWEAEYRVVLPTGEVRWISSRSRIELDSTGKPSLARGVYHDITDRKEAEIETQKLRREITHAGRVSLMGQLASALAHEINQPLGAILRNAEAAELFMQETSPDLDEIRAILADIRKDDQRASNVIGRMRGLLKRQELDKRSLNLCELIDEVAALVRSDLSVRHVNLEVAVADHLPPVLGDSVHLQQVLLNLIVNGMDAIDEANLGDRRLRVAAALNGENTVEVEVSDSGRGIPSDKIACIFDAFYTTKANGMGMGLPISRTIIEAHNGKLWAENSNDGGATFRFTLPIVEVGLAK
jgi:two-component system, LuxR family, sensor kinase FixL